MKIWDKANTNLSEKVEKFTVGNDREFDVLLAKYDVTGTIAHVKMLGTVGLMTEEESKQAVRALEQILKEIENSGFKIEDNIEDVHSQIEFLLIQRIGETGKKIHSGRSRNDQVAVDIKLFLRDELLQIKDEVKKLFDLLIAKSEKFKNYLLPGYTHLQIAMPSSFGLWFGAYAESLIDDLELVAAAYAITNKNPLGSGAGFGSAFPLNRKLTTALLNFETLNWNSVYAQMSRGKTEKIVSYALSSIAATLSKLSMDATLYLNQNFGFISFPDELTTGSSIMPHKKNPDVFELIRGKCNRIQSVPNELTILGTNLPSGYHRDIQLTKEIVFPAIQDLKDCLQMMHLMMSNISVTEDLLDDIKYQMLFTVEVVNELVKKGMPFRDAYKKVAEQIEEGEFDHDQKTLHHTHEGSIGNLTNDDIRSEMAKVLKKIPA